MARERLGIWFPDQTKEHAVRPKRQRAEVTILSYYPINKPTAAIKTLFCKLVQTVVTIWTRIHYFSNESA